MIRSYQIGGDPDKEAFLEKDLDIKLVEAQEDGIKILSVTPFTISRAWSCKQKAYVSTQVFIIIMDIPETKETNCDTCKFDGMCPSSVRLLVAHNGCTTWTPKQTATEERKIDITTGYDMGRVYMNDEIFTERSKKRESEDTKCLH